jgi:DcuC family C4-dicarboxylate transporter
VTVALAVVALGVAFALIWRGYDVRIVLFIASLTIGIMAASAGVVLRKTAESLADAKFVLPICSAMGFAYVVRETGCVEALVRLLLRPLAGRPRLVLGGSASVALVVNMAIPSQSSTLAAVGPLAVALLARLKTRARDAGAALVFGASIAGALMNPGVAELVAAAQTTGTAAPKLAVHFAPGIVMAFALGAALLFASRGRRQAATDALLAVRDGEVVSAAARVAAYKALIPPLPVVWLLLGHPSLPWHSFMARAMPAGLEVFAAMLGGSALALLVHALERRRAKPGGTRLSPLRALFEGMGWAFAHVITIIAVSTGTAKALEAAGVLGALVDLAAGSALAALVVAFALAFTLAVVSGSGTAASVALLTAICPRAGELGVAQRALVSAILFGAEAGRTCSPVAAVLLFGAELVAVPPRQLTLRLILPCLCAGVAGATLCVAVTQQAGVT